MSATISVGSREVPAIGLGLWKIAREDTAEMVRSAIAEGYRHLDSAADYGNEAEVGEGLRAALSEGLASREDLWVTSKLWNTYHRPEHVRTACERTLQDLRLSELDLYLIHFPIALQYVDFDTRYPPEWIFDPNAENPVMVPDPVPLSETWGAMEDLVRAGPRTNQIFHRPPGFRKRHGVGHHHGILGIGIENPLWRIASVKIDVLERDREVNEIQIQLAQAEILQGPLTGCAHVLGPVIGIPEL